MTQTVGDIQTMDIHLCGECAKPSLARQEASRQGYQPCAFCASTAIIPLPGVKTFTYACCACRGDYRKRFLAICAEQRPDLLKRSEGDIFFFDRCFEPGVEDWADATGRSVIEFIRQSAK